MVLPDRTGMERARVNCAATSISGKEFGEGCVKVIGNKGGDDVFIAVGNDEEVTRANSVEVVLPTRAREYTWLGACGTRSASLCVSVHRLSLQRFNFGLLV